MENGDSPNPGGAVGSYVVNEAQQLANDKKLDEASTELAISHEMLKEIGSELRVIFVNGWDEESSEYIRGLLANKILRLQYLARSVRTKITGVQEIFESVRNSEPEVCANIPKIADTVQYLTHCEGMVAKLVDRLPGLVWRQIEPPLYE